MAMAMARAMEDNILETIFIGDSMVRWYPFGQIIHKLDASIRTVAYTITDFKKKNQIRFSTQKPTPELAIIFTGKMMWLSTKGTIIFPQQTKKL